MSHDAKQYCLLHSEDESWESLQSAGLKYERQQRLYTELGALSKRFVNELGEQQVDESPDADELVQAVGQGCSRCGKRAHKTEECTTNMTNVKCFKCGKFGHIGRNCRETKKPDGGKGSQPSAKAKPKPNPKAKPKSQG